MIRRCPHCESDCDDQSFTDGSDVQPAPGDLSVCIYCGTPLVFTESLQLRLLCFFEWAQLGDEEREAIRRARALCAEYKLSGGRCDQ